VQPKILFPILIFAFTLGAFFITFFNSVKVEENKPVEVELLTHEEFLQMERDLARKKELAQQEKKRVGWLESFQESHIKDHDYPAKEVSIHLQLYKPAPEKLFTLSTEYLEPYHNFCVNQVLKKTKNVRYKIIEKDDMIKFIMKSPNRPILEKLIQELKFYDIRAVLKN
jgi:hypothetical protein